mmetsp:Transcript_24086/g.77659  ORF Transcript_24086/g.77659 Transcript_24086/m.77659 type:complete len:227 (+) Transcript_24086:126-806(+)
MALLRTARTLQRDVGLSSPNEQLSEGVSNFASVVGFPPEAMNLVVSLLPPERFGVSCGGNRVVRPVVPIDRWQARLCEWRGVTRGKDLPLRPGLRLVRHLGRLRQTLLRRVWRDGVSDESEKAERLMTRGEGRLALHVLRGEARRLGPSLLRRRRRVQARGRRGHRQSDEAAEHAALRGRAAALRDPRPRGRRLRFSERSPRPRPRPRSGGASSSRQQQQQQQCER